MDIAILEEGNELLWYVTKTNKAQHERVSDENNKVTKAIIEVSSKALTSMVIVILKLRRSKKKDFNLAELSALCKKDDVHCSH